MEIKIEKTKNLCETKVTAVTEGEEWSKAQEDALKSLASKVTIKGFRKGHAPLAQAQKAIGQSEILNNAADKAVNKAYNEMMKNEDIKPMLQPELVVNEFTAKKLSITFTVVTAPIVTLGEYKGIEIEKKAVRVLKADIDAELNAMAAKHAELEVVEDGIAAEKGYTAVIDFVGFVDGKPFDGGEAANYELELGSNTFVPGFEDQLIGVKKGETKDVIISFPENYVADLAGKEATFKVTINELKKKVTPEINDDFAKDCDIEGVDTLEQLTAHVKENLKTKKTKEAADKQLNDLLNKITDNATFEMHTKLIEEDAKNIVKNFKNRIESQGFDVADYYKMTNTSEEKLMEQARGEAVTNAKHVYVLDQVGKVEKIELSKEEVNDKMTELAKQYNMKVEDLTQQLGNRFNEFVANIRNEKIIAFLKENNKL